MLVLKINLIPHTAKEAQRFPPRQRSLQAHLLRIALRSRRLRSLQVLPWSQRMLQTRCHQLPVQWSALIAQWSLQVHLSRNALRSLRHRSLQVWCLWLVGLTFATCSWQRSSRSTQYISSAAMPSEIRLWKGVLIPYTGGSSAAMLSMIRQ